MVDSDIIEIVSNLNREIEDMMWGEEKIQPPYWTPIVEFKTDGYVQCIEFLGEYLWDSDNDPRKFDEDTDQYEDLEVFIRREIAKLLEGLKKVNIVDKVIDTENLSRIAYETYCKSVGGMAFNGDKLPDWINVPGRIADAWRFSIIEVIKNC